MKNVAEHYVPCDHVYAHIRYPVSASNFLSQGKETSMSPLFLAHLRATFPWSHRLNRCLLSFPFSQNNTSVPFHFTPGHLRLSVLQRIASSPTSPRSFASRLTNIPSSWSVFFSSLRLAFPFWLCLFQIWEKNAYPRLWSQSTLSAHMVRTLPCLPFCTKNII